jgi:hypothetical protein
MARKKTTGRIENGGHDLGPGEKPDPRSKYIQVYLTPDRRRKGSRKPASEPPRRIP